jgi:hypothetical protein
VWVHSWLVSSYCSYPNRASGQRRFRRS